jgi:hypothetical protein
MEATWPAGKGPVALQAQNSKSQVRNSLQVGWTWEEEWPPMDGRGADIMAELTASADEWFRSGTRVSVRPWTLRNTRSSPAAGTNGNVNGASQSGTTLVTDGWPANATFKRRDYLVVAGVPYSLKIMADTTADGSGNATFTIGPPIFVGPAQPSNNALITLNGLLDCFIIDPPQMPETFNGTEWYAGLRLKFTEAVPSITLGDI